MTLDARFEETIVRARAGHRRALEDLYLDLHPRVLRYLELQARDAGEDLASETWLGVAAALPSFKGDEDDFRAFVFTIARRRLLDLRRRDARHATVPVDPAALAAIGPQGDVEADAFEHLGTGWALDVLGRLSPDQADVVMLRVLGDLSAGRVASILGKRPEAVRALQLRALRRLARELRSEAVTP